MASRAILGDPDSEDVRDPQNVAVVWKYQGTLVSIGVHAVCGCTEVERVSRIPGSQDRVSGVISFKGEIIPVLSLFRQPLRSPCSKAKAENYAIVLSVSGLTFAVEVNEVPSVIIGPQVLDGRGDKLCRMREKHLQRLLQFHISRSGLNTMSAGEIGG
ncbi:MAG: hypothetical protein AMJ46_03020 [Latescibacteria bacterium DG_63]|nr:MAG: hypothetical protein AMJ46_03020 [Latescibacteria bacterium DG_63]